MLNHVPLGASMAERDSSDEEPTIAEDVVVTKYKMAGDMANREFNHIFRFYWFLSVDKGVLKAVIDACVEGAKVLDLCQLGDQMILEETGKVFKKEKEMKKGQYIYIMASHYFLCII